jgi:hypothetical protein
MGACSKANNSTPIPIATFRAMLEATEKLFPWVKKEKIFFNDVGARMQRLEGEIGLGMFLWAINEEVPMLSVHDAYAVKEKDEGRTSERMDKEWIKVINKNKQTKNRRGSNL